MNRKIFFYYAKGIIPMLFVGWLILWPPKLHGQSVSHYDFVYIDISKIEELDHLQDQLDTLYAKIKDHKFVFYLSNSNKPIIAKDARKFKSLVNSISNLTTSLPNLVKDIENINRVFNENDFLQLAVDENSGRKVIKTRYNKICWYFFFSPTLLVSANMKNDLIDFLILENFALNDVSPPEVILNFEKEAIKILNKSDVLSSLEKSGFKIQQY